MGQSRNVVVYRLLTENSIYVSMLEVLGDKAKLFDLYARDSQVASLALDEQKEADEEKSVQQKVLKLEKRKSGERSCLAKPQLNVKKKTFSGMCF